MNNDTITAKNILLESGYTCVLYANGKDRRLRWFSHCVSR